MNEHDHEPGPPELPEVHDIVAKVTARVLGEAQRAVAQTRIAERYSLIEPLGSGSMARVWRAFDEPTGAEVAIKILKSRDLCEGTGVERMLREARLTQKIHDRHIVRVLDVGRHHDGAYLVMELVEGRSLADVLRTDAPVPWARARDMLSQIARGLATAHAVGVLHRDLKPANVLVSGTDTQPHCTVIDFGLARPLGIDPDTGKLTRTGLVFGTPLYISPEQLQAERVDARADVYALGCIAYEMLAGQTLIRSGDGGDALLEHLYVHPQPFAVVAPSLDIPPGAESLVLRATRKDPSLRFADMDAFARALATVDRGERVSVPPEELELPEVESSQSLRERLSVFFPWLNRGTP
jgi:eukaryotic-like serine/threonine-protein kinase